MHTQQTQNGSLTYDWLVLNTILQMRNAKANEQWYKYWVHFKYAMQLLVPYMSVDIRKKIEKDYQELLAEIKKIEEKDIAKASKEREIEALKVEFAEAHEFYILSSLSRVGIVKVNEDGMLDFNTFDFAKLRAAINQTNYKKLEGDNEQVD
jgi:hypothetical protein